MYTYTYAYINMYVYIHVQPIAFGVSFLQSQISIDGLFLYLSFATSHQKDVKESEIVELN